MIVSLYHRLLGISVAIAQHQHFATDQPTTTWAAMQRLTEQFCRTGDGAGWQPTWTADPLENGFLCLPLLLFYHEDPDYLGDRLTALTLPADHFPFVLDLGRFLSACLREKLTGETLGEWGQAFVNLGIEFPVCQKPGQTWLDFTGVVRDLELGLPTQQLLMVYGAIAYGQGRWDESLALVRAEAFWVNLWVAIFCGAIRGDRRLPYALFLGRDYGEIREQVLQFWSRWSGIPPQNQLHLDQLPLIASPSVLQYRPQLQLISQRHLV
ncbi:hypothetical protein FLX56_22550 [Synechococcus moorigangaii CMS01]|nr:hypothetical protein [Synechococcus moorigangaii CMS01]